MSVLVRKRCNNCGRRFEIDVLTPDEQEEARRQQKRTYPIACPDCHRTDIRDGWE